MKRNLVFITGAPRSGTTPTGHVLSQGARNSLLYEIFGPTGEKRNIAKYPMIDVNIDRKIVKSILNDIGLSKFELKKQTRPSHYSENSLARVGLWLFGTQTRRSALRLKFNPTIKNIIVKDPHLSFMSGDLTEMGYKVVMTYRSALAQASSFKRLDWEPNVQDLYRCYSLKFGRDKLIEFELNKSAPLTNTIKSTILWRMVYSSNSRIIDTENFFLVKSKELEDFEKKKEIYLKICSAIGLGNERSVIKYLSKIEANGKLQQTNKTHDFNRSIEFTNNYWETILTASEVEKITELSADIENRYR